MRLFFFRFFSRRRKHIFTRIFCNDPDCVSRVPENHLGHSATSSDRVNEEKPEKGVHRSTLLFFGSQNRNLSYEPLSWLLAVSCCWSCAEYNPRYCHAWSTRNHSGHWPRMSCGRTLLVSFPSRIGSRSHPGRAEGSRHYCLRASNDMHLQI